MLHSVDLLIGADGSHSVVRGAVGVAFEPQDTLVLPGSARDGVAPEEQQKHSLRLDALEQTTLIAKFLQVQQLQPIEISSQIAIILFEPLNHRRFRNRHPQSNLSSAQNSLQQRVAATAETPRCCSAHRRVWWMSDHGKKLAAGSLIHSTQVTGVAIWYLHVSVDRRHSLDANENCCVCRSGD
eukprot:COSAG02_NODE_2387_length_8986_cov_12.395184_4_plen_183_part_00